MKKRQKIIFDIAVLLITAMFTLAGCGDTAEVPARVEPDLSGTVTVIPNAEVTINTLLTAYYYGGTETIATYQWKRGDDNVGTNANTYTPVEAGLYYVTVSAPGYKSKTSTAIAVIAAGDPELSGNVTINHTIDVKVNTELTATYSGGTETIETYQWKRDSENVGTNSNTYTPAEAGLYTVTVSAAGYKSKTSAAVNVTSAAGNTAPKSLYVIGITEEYLTQGSDGAIALIFPAGTALDDAEADLKALYLESGYPEHAIAGVNFNSVQRPVLVDSTYAVSFPLYESNEAPWTGSGTVDFYSLVSNGTKAYLYKIPNLLIQSAVTTVSLFNLEVASLGEIDLPQVPSISGTITLTNIPAGFAPGRIWINVDGFKEGSRLWHNESHGGNDVNFSFGNTNLPWRIKISDFVWDNSGNAGRTDFFPADLSFRVHVHFDGGDNDTRNYWVSVPAAPKQIDIEAEAVNIDLGVVNLDENKHYYVSQ